MRIGIDIDHPLYPFVFVFKRWLERKTNATFPPPKRWDFYLDWGYTVNEFAALIKKGYDENVVFVEGAPTLGCKEVLEQLARDHELVAITHRPAYAEDATYNWLDKWGLWFDDVIVTDRNKYEFGLDLLLDDCPTIIENFRAAGKPAVVFDAPWNRHVLGPRVSTWREFEKIVNDMELSGENRTWEDVFGERRVTDPVTGGQKGMKQQRMDLLPYDTLMRVSEHYGYGATKYEDRNWERGYAYSLTMGALMRHLAAWWHGEDIDPDSGNPHLSAVVFHALALATFELRGVGSDDRPR